MKEIVKATNPAKCNHDFMFYPAHVQTSGKKLPGSGMCANTFNDFYEKNPLKLSHKIGLGKEYLVYSLKLRFP